MFAQAYMASLEAVSGRKSNTGLSTLMIHLLSPIGYNRRETTRKEERDYFQEHVVSGQGGMASN